MVKSILWAILQEYQLSPGMYCASCGEEVDESENFCPSCGESLREEATSDERTDATESNTEDSEISTGRRVGYWMARIVQFGLTAFAILLLLGGISSNVLAFLIVAVFALVLFAIVVVIELLVIRPLGT